MTRKAKAKNGTEYFYPNFYEAARAHRVLSLNFTREDYTLVTTRNTLKTPPRPTDCKCDVSVLVGFRGMRFQAMIVRHGATGGLSNVGTGPCIANRHQW